MALPNHVESMIEQFMGVGDWAAWHPIADALTEAGQDDMAAAALWIYEQRRRPVLDPNEMYEGWHWETQRPGWNEDTDADKWCFLLPELLTINTMFRDPRWGAGCNSSLEAYEWLLQVVAGRITELTALHWQAPMRPMTAPQPLPRWASDLTKAIDRVDRSLP